MASYRAPNPYFMTPGGADIGAGISNLATAMFGDPLRAGQMAYQAAQAKLADAETNTANQRTRLLQQQGDAPGMLRNGIAQAMFRQSPDVIGPPEPPTMQVQHAMPSLGEALAQGDPSGGIGQLGKLVGVLLANSGASDNAIIRNNGGQGLTIGKDDAVSLTGQDAIRTGNFNQENKLEGMRQGGANSRNAADIAERRWAEIFGQGAETARDAVRNAAALDRQNSLPVQTGEGGTTTFRPGDPRAPDGGVVHGTPTESTVLGQVLGDYASGKPQNPNAVALARAKGGISAQDNKRVIDFKDLKAVDDEIDNQFGISFNSKTGAPNPGSQPDVPPDLRAKVRADAVALYQSGVDPAVAVSKAIEKNVSITPAVAGGLFGIGSRDRTYSPAQPGAASLPATGDQTVATPPAASSGVDFATAGRAEAIKAKVKAGAITREQGLAELKALGFGD